MNKIKIGSIWAGNDYSKFRVIDTVEVDGHAWVHYIKIKPLDSDPKEYSCYEESFVARFNETPE